MIIHQPHLMTTMEVWTPRYSDAYTDTGERVALLAQYKVQKATPVIIVEFTKAKHLKGLRFCITKEQASRYPLDSNGTIPCYAVPMSAFQSWETPSEVRQVADMLFDF